MPAIEEKGSEVMQKSAEDTRAKALDAMFSGTEEPARVVQPDEPEVRKPGQPDANVDADINKILDGPPKEEKPPEAKVPEEKPPEKEVKDLDGDIDFDAKPEDLKPKEIEVPDEIEGLDDKQQRSIATMRDQLKLAGGRAKDAEASLAESGLEVTRLKKEIDELKAQATSPKAVVADPQNDPEIKRMIDSLASKRDNMAMRMDSEEQGKFVSGFEGMLRGFADAQNAANGPARDALLKTLKDGIIGDFGDNQVDRIMDVLADNHGSFTDILAKIDGFGELAETHEMEAKVSGWDKSQAKALATINSIANMDSELIDANPHTSAAYVAKMVRDNPAYAARAEQVKAAVIESFEGKRPLTIEELQTIKESEAVDGIKADDFLKGRTKRTAKLRNDAMKRQYLMMMLSPELPDIFKELAELRQKKGAESAERDALLDVTGPVSKKPTTGDKHVRAQDRPSAASRVTSVM